MKIKKQTSDRYLKDTIEDALKKVGSQHSISKEMLILLCLELQDRRASDDNSGE